MKNITFPLLTFQVTIMWEAIKVAKQEDVAVKVNCFIAYLPVTFVVYPNYEVKDAYRLCAKAYRTKLSRHSKKTTYHLLS